jgi:hypothetical protein
MMPGQPPVMPQGITNMPPDQLVNPQPEIPTVAPAHPGNMPGGLPLPNSMPPQMAQPGSQPPPFITEDQGNGTALIRATNPDGSPGPVLKVVSLPKQKAPPAPGAAPQMPTPAPGTPIPQ